MDNIESALKGLFVLFLVACSVVPGATMLLFPKRAFTTMGKPRWLGLPFLILGLWLLYYIVWPIATKGF